MSKNEVSKNGGSTNERSKLQEDAGQRKQPEKQRRKPDRRKVDQRIRRTCERLGSALVTLIQEKPIDDVTVQEVLDRASVGRSTFYLHYRDKDDPLLSQFEKFLKTMSTALSIRKEESHRARTPGARKPGTRDVPHFPPNFTKRGTHARADFTSVREKSWPLNRSGSPLVFASAQEKQSPKFSL